MCPLKVSPESVPIRVHSITMWTRKGSQNWVKLGQGSCWMSPKCPQKCSYKYSWKWPQNRTQEMSPKLSPKLFPKSSQKLSPKMSKKLSKKMSKKLSMLIMDCPLKYPWGNAKIRARTCLLQSWNCKHHRIFAATWLLWGK